RAGRVCPKCRYAFRITARDRVAQLIDHGTFEEHDGGVAPGDPLGFKDTKRYRDRVRAAREKTGHSEAVLTGIGRLGGFPVVMAAFEFAYLGGSMGSAVGEKLTRAIELAIAQHLPGLILAPPGGARLPEGLLSLLPMAPTPPA